jgi:hypothetical protein
MRRFRVVGLVAAILACATTTATTLPASGGLGPKCVTALDLSLHLELPSDDPTGRPGSEGFTGSEISSLHFRRESSWVSLGPDGLVHSPMLRLRLAAPAAERVAAIEPLLWKTVNQGEAAGSLTIPARYSLLLLAGGTEVLRGGHLHLERGIATADFVAIGVDFESFRRASWTALGCK